MEEEIFKWLTFIQKHILNFLLLRKSLSYRHGDRMLYRNDMKFHGVYNLILIQVL